MGRLDDILTELKQIAEHPNQAVQKLAARGEKIIGVAPYYAPEELVYAAGMLPVGLWGGKVTVTGANRYFPIFACPLVKSILELAIQGAYDGLAAVMIPLQCENNKFLGQNFQAARPDLPFIGLVAPYRRQTPEGIAYLKTEFGRIASELSGISGNKITNESLGRSIDIYNEHRRWIRAFTETAPAHPSIITPRLRHAVVKSAYFMDKADHTVLLKELVALLEARPVEQGGSRIVVSGIMAEPEGLLDIFEELKIVIVEDDLAQESRQFRVDVPPGGDPLDRLARRWSLMGCCSLLLDPKKERIGMLTESIMRCRADGLIVLMMKFCDPEEMDYPFIREAMSRSDIPHLYLDIEPQMQLEQARTRLQSFIEIVRQNPRSA